MKKSVIVFLLLFVCIISCNKHDLPKGTPKCIENEINKLENLEPQNPRASVWRYKFKGEYVYYIPSACCDIPSKLYDSNCNLICSPDGGFTGTGDGKCTDFHSTKTEEKLIWKDKR